MKRPILGRFVIFLVVVLIAALYAVRPPKLGLDLQGGVELLFLINMDDVPLERQDTVVAETIEILIKRLNTRGMMDIRIQPQGSNGILIQVPGATINSAQWIRELIEKSGKLQFMVVCYHNDVRDRWRKSGHVPNGYIALPPADPKDNGGEDYLLRIPEHQNNNDEVITGELIKIASLGMDNNGLPAVRLQFDPLGARRFGKLTEKNKGNRLAIVLDGMVYSAPNINEPIYGGNAIITQPNGFSQEDASSLIAILKAGSLPASLQFEGVPTGVGPTLGRDSIDQGKRAALYGLIGVAAFMVVYYMTAGFIADLALCINLLLILGALVLFQADLTLPGIAGIVLTLGMAVDANVLIFERIKEEEKGRQDIGSAIDAGYKRAFVTILDANITTFITALILYVFGTGPVKGFATTLMIGIAASLFTALFVTKIVFDFLLDKGWITRFPTLRLYRAGALPFLNFGKATLAASALLILVGLGIFAAKGEENLDIDFVGGTLIQLKFHEAIPIEEVRAKIRAAGMENASVQKVWSTGDAGDKDREYTIRTSLLDPDLAREKMEQIFADRLLPPRFEDDRTVPDEQGTSFLVRLAEPASADRMAKLLTEFADNPKTPPVLTGDPAFSWNASEIAGASGRQFRISVPLSPVHANLLKDFLGKHVQLAESSFKRVSTIGSEVATSMIWRAILSLLLSMIVILFYIRIRFEKYSYGFAAIIALAHDVLITLGVLALLGTEINLTILAALLTIIGYSLNDTIVVFDRIRENTHITRTEDIRETINKSINQTLGRTINTSVTTLLVVAALYFFGGGVIHGFSVAMGIGVIAGTYSSIFIASPVMALIETRQSKS